MGDRPKTLISTLYSLEPVVPSIHRFSPAKLVLFVDEQKNETIAKNIRDITRMFSKVMAVEPVYVKQYDIYHVARKTVEYIEKEFPNSEIYINLTGGRKTLMLGVLYGAYARENMVQRILYCTEEDSSFIELPKMGFELNKVERALLEIIGESESAIQVADTAKKLGKTRGLLYMYLKTLKARGFLDESFKITQAGRIALL